MAHTFFSVLGTLLRKTMKPPHRVGMFENKKPDIFQTFDGIAFTACFLFLLGTLYSFFSLKLFLLRDKERMKI